MYIDGQLKINLELDESYTKDVKLVACSGPSSKIVTEYFYGSIVKKIFLLCTKVKSVEDSKSN